ncbi:hypothetical protein ACLOJK_027428 [Asimina triloba]
MAAPSADAPQARDDTSYYPAMTAHCQRPTHLTDRSAATHAVAAHHQQHPTGGQKSQSATPFNSSDKSKPTSGHPSKQQSQWKSPNPDPFRSTIRSIMATDRQQRESRPTMEIIKSQSGENQPWLFAKLTIFLQIQNVERHPGVHANRDSVHRWAMATHLELDSKRTSKNLRPMEAPQRWAALGDDNNLTASTGPRS